MAVLAAQVSAGQRLPIRERGNVLQVTHSSSGNLAGLFIASTSAKNFSNYAGGNIVFDIKVVSGNSNITMKIDCVLPAHQAIKSLGSKGASGWETVTVSVASLVSSGLNLSQCRYRHSDLGQ